MREIKIGPNDANQRVDKFLTKSLVNLSGSLLYKLLRTKRIKLNGKKCEPNVKLRDGDVFTLFISDEFFPAKEIDGYAKYNLPIYNLSPDEIAYEDKNIIVIDKKNGVTVHSGELNEKKNTKGNEIYLIDKLIGYLYKKKEYVPENENSFTPSLCNRLDRNTAGLVIAAKNAESLRVMNQKIRDREIRKIYYCEVEGGFNKPSATLSDFLYKDKVSNRVYIFKTKEKAKSTFKTRYDDDIKTVVTKYREIDRSVDTSLLEIELVTGRTHQIRAHMAFYGHPLIGDSKYGKVHSKNKTDLHQHLYSYSVEFVFSTDASILSYLDGKKICGIPKEFMTKYKKFSIQKSGET